MRHKFGYKKTPSRTTLAALTDDSQASSAEQQSGPRDDLQRAAEERQVAQEHEEEDADLCGRPRLSPLPRNARLVWVSEADQDMLTKQWSDTRTAAVAVRQQQLGETLFACAL